MVGAGVVQAIWGVKAEGRSLEDLATPILAEEAGAPPGGDDRGGPGRRRDRTAPPGTTPRLGESY